MTITFPRTRADFWEKLGVMQVEAFHIDEAVINDRGADGTLLQSRYGTQKWLSKVVLKPRRTSESVRIEGLIAGLRGTGSFYAWDPRKSGPALDPAGANVAGSTVQVRSIGSNNRSLSLKGLPSGYALSIGDMLTINWGDNYRLLLRVLEDITASGTNTAEFEVQPFLPAGLQVDDAVILVRPYGEFIITPGSLVMPTNTGNRSSSITFEIEEV